MAPDWITIRCSTSWFDRSATGRECGIEKQNGGNGERMYVPREEGVMLSFIVY